MKTWIKRTLIGVGSLVAIVGVAVVVAAVLGERKLHRHIKVAVSTVPLPTDAASIERGAYLFRSRGCGECHAPDGAGSVVIDDGAMIVRAPNITGGAGGATAAYTPVDWVRTVRHGVKPDGQPIMIMPSEEYNRLTDIDLGAIVAYVRQLPPRVGAGRARSTALAGEGSLRPGPRPRRRGEDRPQPATASARTRGCVRNVRCLRREQLHGLSPRRPQRRQDRGRAAELAARGTARTR